MIRPTKTTLSKVLAALVFGAGLGACCGAAQSGTMQLLVTDKEGKSVPDVVVLVEAAMPAVVRAAAAPVMITQENQRFVPFLGVVPAGSTLRFVNRDTYDHHARSTPSGPLGSIPAAKNFELRLDGVEGAPSPNDEYESPAGARKRSGAGSGTSQRRRQGRHRRPDRPGLPHPCLDARPGLCQRHTVVRQDRRQRRRHNHRRVRWGGRTRPLAPGPVGGTGHAAGAGKQHANEGGGAAELHAAPAPQLIATERT